MMLKGKGGQKVPFTDYTALNYLKKKKKLQELNKVSTFHIWYKEYMEYNTWDLDHLCLPLLCALVWVGTALL